MTLPPINVWITHDGSAECPLPVGTIFECNVSWFQCRSIAGDNWSNVDRYRVISYPETNDE